MEEDKYFVQFLFILGHNNTDEDDSPEYYLTHMSANLQHNNKSPSAQPSILDNVNTSCDDATIVSSIVHKLIENIENITDSNVLKNGT